MEPNVLKILILVLTLSSANSQKCPKGCTCPTNIINCVGVFSFPNLSGTTQAFLNIYRATLPVIPPNAFRDNANLRSISIYQVTVGRIMTCAFSGLRELNLVTIYQGNITTIESGAFSNMTFDTESTININSVYIGTIEPYAFSSFANAKSFSIYKANVTTIKPFAFYNLTLNSFSIYSANISVIETYAFSDFSAVRNINVYLSIIGLLQCDALSNLMATGRLNINRIDLNCDCNIAWAFASNFTFPPSITCMKPPSLANRELRELNVTAVCPSGNYSRTCPKPSVSLPGPCPVPVSASNQIDTDAVLMMTLMMFSILKTFA